MTATEQTVALMVALAAAGCGSSSKLPRDARAADADSGGVSDVARESSDGARDAAANDALPAEGTADRQGQAATCIGTGGNAVTGSCCQVVGDFADTCAVGACGCAPASSHPVLTCSCPAGTCFSPDNGCVGRAGACTPGADQSCNDNPTISSLHGQCTPGGRCVCRPTYTMNPDTGRCL